MISITDKKSSDFCPFGSELQRYWNKRYRYFLKFDEGIQTDAEGLYSVVPEAIAMHHAALIQGKTVVDGFTGIGGVAIALARSGKRVTTIELDPKRLQMARHNAAVYGVEESIAFINGDVLQLLATLDADAVYLDPPWGGPARRRSPPFLLRDFHTDGLALLTIALGCFDEVLLKAPPNFDLQELARFNVPFHVYDDVDYDEKRVISRAILFRTQL